MLQERLKKPFFYISEYKKLIITELSDTIATMLADRFRQLSRLPRQNNRAKIFFIPRGLFSIFADDEWVSLPDIEEEHDRVLNYLRQQGDLRRGDIIIVEERLDDSNRADLGKFAFDGEKIIRWTCDPECSDGRFIPEEFQVIMEFPIRYWDNAFDSPDDMYVPFDVAQHLPNITSANIYPAKGFEPFLQMEALPFLGRDGQVYYIIGSTTSSNYDFDTDVKHQKYFEVVDDYTLEYPNVCTPR